MRSEENLNENKLQENDLNNQQSESESCFKNKKILIALIVGAVIVIVVVVVLAVVLTKKSDDSSENNDNVDDIGDIGDERWVEAYKKAKSFLNSFSYEEKYRLLYGDINVSKKCVGGISPIPERNFPGICLQDGPAGVRPSDYTTTWQAAINSAATFNKDLVYQIGAAQGGEFKTKGVNIMLTPCINIMKHPKGGRIWETFGEDAFLTGELGAKVIEGMQSEGVMACAKHYVGNEHETYRRNSSSNIPEEALFEIYIEPFYKAIKKGDVITIMESYNAVNGTFMTRHKRLLQEVLKDKMNFKGFIMSDWWAINTDSSDNFANGLDMNMPGGMKFPTSMVDLNTPSNSWWEALPDWVASGAVTKERVDDAALRIIASMYKVNLIPDSYDESKAYPNGVDLQKNTITDTTLEINRKAARESFVLLQNEGNVLPLAKNKKNTAATYSKFAVVGNSAKKTSCTSISNNVCYDSEGNRYYEGHLYIGWGSGATDINYNYISEPLDAISKKVQELGGTITSSTNLINKGNNFYEEDVDSVETTINGADVIIVFIMANSGEDTGAVEQTPGDRTSFDVWHKGNDLVQKVITSKTDSQKVIVIINSPAVVNLGWKESVDTILFIGMPGAQSGNAIVNILFGDYSPSGHLPYVWANFDDYSDSIAGSYEEFESKDYITANYIYKDNLFVGQRWFDKNTNLNYIYPFGFGLSYSDFTFSSLTLTMKESGLIVKFNVTNSGLYKASVVAMVFLTFPEEVKNYPIRVFKGFEKKELDVNQSSEIEIIIEPHDLSYYSVNDNDFVRPKSGKYKVYVGVDAKDYNKLEKEVDASY